MNPRHVVRIARVDLVRRYRSVRADGRRFAALLAAVALAGVPVAAAAAAAYFFGAGIANGSVAAPTPVARYAAGGIVAVLAVVVTLRTAQQGATPAHPDGLLTTVPHAEAALGVLGSELAVSGGVAAVPALVVAVAFGAGSGSLPTVATAAAAVVAVVALGVTLGVVLGTAVRNVFARSRTLARYRTALGVAVVAAYFAVVFSQSESNAFLPVMAALSATPAGWFGDLAVVALGGRPPLAAGAVGVFLLGSTVLPAAVIRLTASLWYVEPARPTERAAGRSGLGDLPGLSLPTARVVRKTWRRAWRNPIRLVYVLYPLFLLYTPVANSVRAGQVPATLPPLVALYGAWAVGAAFTLNPLGDEGNVLPVTLTAPVSGRQFVGALCLAALAVGLPAVTVATLAAGVASPLGPAAGVLAALAGAVLTVSGTGIAAGVGTLFPRLEAVRITRSREAVVPSLLAFGGYSLVLGLVGLPATLVSVPGASELGASLAGVSPDVVVLAGLGTTTLLGAGAALVGFVSAARTFDRFTYDRE
jgi:hypothetical protein